MSLVKEIKIPVPLRHGSAASNEDDTQSGYPASACRSTFTSKKIHPSVLPQFDKGLALLACQQQVKKIFGRWCGKKEAIDSVLSPGRLAASTLDYKPKKNEHIEGRKVYQPPSSKMDHTSLEGHGTTFAALFDSITEMLQTHKVIENNIDR